jgi:hypothetical protein
MFEKYFLEMFSMSLIVNALEKEQTKTLRTVVRIFKCLAIQQLFSFSVACSILG